MMPKILSINNYETYFVDNSFTNKSNLQPPDENINPYDRNQVLNCYIYDFEINLNSIISNIFYGTVQGEFECLNCKAQLSRMGQNIPNINSIKSRKINYKIYLCIII